MRCFNERYFFVNRTCLEFIFSYNSQSIVTMIQPLKIQNAWQILRVMKICVDGRF